MNYLHCKGTVLCNVKGPKEGPAPGTAQKRTQRTVKGGRQETVHISSDRILHSFKRYPGIWCLKGLTKPFTQTHLFSFDKLLHCDVEEHTQGTHDAYGNISGTSGGNFIASGTNLNSWINLLLCYCGQTCMYTETSMVTFSHLADDFIQSNL